MTTCTFPRVARLIGQQVNFNALEAINAVAMGFDTPLVDTHSLRGDVEAIQAADTNEVLAEVHAQKWALTQARRATPQEVVGYHHMQGLKIPIVAPVVVTAKTVKGFRA